MKQIILAAATLAFISNATAQKISVKDGSEKFSNGSHNAYTATIYETSKDDVMSKWKSVLKDFKNEKVKTDNGEIFGDNIVIKDWGNNPVDIYTSFEEDKNAKTITMHVAFDLGGAYLTGSDGDKHSYAKKMVKDFAVKTTKESMGDKVKDLEKVLDKLEDNQKDLEKDNKGYKSDIEDYKGKIKKAEDNISKNEADQVKKKSEIEAQKKVVDEAKKVMDKVD
jgi:chromosome segregation ATPase